MIIHFVEAQQQDAQALARVSQQAFDHDIHYGAAQVGGPPGYRSPNWHLRVIITRDVYKILDENGRYLGGMIVFLKGFQHMELGRIFIHPDYQNQGLGGQAVQFLEETYPDAKLWTLGTPSWNERNQHFYQKMGYELTGEDGHDGLLYEKRM